jgi:hypothetical protein
MWAWFKAYFRTIGHLLWAILSLRWLEDSTPVDRLKWIDEKMRDDYAINQWFYRRTTLNSFLFGSGNFTLSG